MVRVAGTDPGTSSLDVLILDDAKVADQARFTPQQLRGDPTCPVDWLAQRGPFDLVAGPSGYGLPLRAGKDCSDADLARMTLMRPDERGSEQGVARFHSLVRVFAESSFSVVFLPGVIHLPTVPAHRKWNRIDLGTADKVSVAALALAQCVEHGAPLDQASVCVVELGSVFSACIYIQGGRIVDGAGGTSGAVGWGSAGSWDGELAYWLGPLHKGDLFNGGAASAPESDSGTAWLVESLCKCVAGMQAIHGSTGIVVSGRLLELEPEVADKVCSALGRLAKVCRLTPLPGAWVKHAAQGAAVLADGLAGGRYASLVERLTLRQAAGDILDWVCHPAAERIG